MSSRPFTSAAAACPLSGRRFSQQDLRQRQLRDVDLIELFEGRGRVRLRPAQGPRFATEAKLELRLESAQELDETRVSDFQCVLGDRLDDLPRLLASALTQQCQSEHEGRVAVFVLGREEAQVDHFLEILLRLRELVSRVVVDPKVVPGVRDGCSKPLLLHQPQVLQRRAPHADEIALLPVRVRQAGEQDQAKGHVRGMVLERGEE